MEFKNIYGVPPLPLEKYHKAIDHINTVVQGRQMQSHNLEVLAQANSFLTRSNTVTLAQLAQMTVTVNDMQAQLKTLAAAPTNQTR